MYTLIVVALAVGCAQAALNPSGCGQPKVPPKECNTGCTRADQDALLEFYRIVGGMAATKDSWPWQAQLKLSGRHYCGGSIVDDNTVITAAHCFEQYSTPGSFKVHAGSYKKYSVDSGEKVYKVTKILKHPKYNKSKIDNDIAIMKISGKFDFNDGVTTVCVADSQPADGSNVFVTGWGSVKGTGNSDVLKQTMVPIVTRSTCNSKYSGRITGNMICAGYDKGGSDACQGDSGGPLVQKKGAQWYLYGITSWGIGCAQAKYPGVYTNVGNYVNWIKQNL